MYVYTTYQLVGMESVPVLLILRRLETNLHGEGKIYNICLQIQMERSVKQMRIAPVH